MEPFEIHVSDAVLDDLRERLNRTRFPDQLEGADWDYGSELGFMRELCEYWRDKFDWRVQEERLNRFDQFTTDVNGLKVHFIHQRSKRDDAFPIVLTHGWPGSVFLFSKVIEPLVEAGFHVVCPSVPGYGWSEAPRKPGFDIKSVAETGVALMAKLGYSRYGAQGGDWGGIATPWIADIDRDHCAGIHLNMVVAGPPEGVENPMEGLTPEELKGIADMGHFAQHETGYQAIQGSKPQTLGYGLNDSPVGLAAWITEKFRTWSDCDGNIENRFSKDDLLTNIMIYWTTQTITSSTRLYCETTRSKRFGPMEGRVHQPTGAAIFPKEIIRPPRTWAEARYNIQHWTVMPRGGHFAALEEPELFAKDVIEFFNTLR